MSFSIGVKSFLKKLLRKAATVAGVADSAQLTNVEASLRAIETSLGNVEALAAGIANIEMELHRLALSDQQANRAPLSSCLCKQSDFYCDEFRKWVNRLEIPFVWTWKTWEFCFIAQALYERGLLLPGRKGLGFGVGNEPLSSLFASFGCEIVATDLSASDPRAAPWIATDQHATSGEQLRKDFCPSEKFDALVTFRQVDMTDVPDDLSGFDFLWSSSSLEHLGSLENGIQFILDAMKCLQPRGIAVHTTSQCVNSEETTLEAKDLAFYRQKDIVDLERRLTAEGHQVAPINFERGNGVLDHYICHLPLNASANLQFELAGYVATSIGLIITRRE